MAYTVLEQVKIRLKQFHIDDSSGTDITVFDHKEENPLLEQLIVQATDEIMSRRMYPESYTKEQIENDMKKYESVIVTVSVQTVPKWIEDDYDVAVVEDENGYPTSITLTKKS